MRSFKAKTLTERLSDQATAKQALVRKLQARPGPDDPAVIARAAERKAVADARAERLAAKAAAAEQLKAEQIDGRPPRRRNASWPNSWSTKRGSRAMPRSRKRRSEHATSATRPARRPRGDAASRNLLSVCKADFLTNPRRRMHVWEQFPPAWHQNWAPSGVHQFRPEGFPVSWAASRDQATSRRGRVLGMRPGSEVRTHARGPLPATCKASTGVEKASNPAAKYRASYNPR